MKKRYTLLLLVLCLGIITRTTAQLNELLKRIKTTQRSPTDAQQHQVIDKSDDQQASGAIISVRYRDKLGKLKTVKAKTKKLSLKRKKPKKSSKLKKNKGLVTKQKLRKKKKKGSKLSFQTLLPTTPVATDVIYEYEYDDEYEYEDYDYYDAPQNDVIIPVFGPNDHDPHHSVPVRIHEDHRPHSFGHNKPHYNRNPHHTNKHHDKKPGYSHVTVETPAYRYNIENYGESHHGYGHQNRPKGAYTPHVKHGYEEQSNYRPQFGYPKKIYPEKPHYPPPKPYYPQPEPHYPINPYHHQPPPSHGYPHQEEIFLTPYAPQPKPYYIQDPYHHYHPDPYPAQHHYPPKPLPPLYHKIPPPIHEAVVVHQEAAPYQHRYGNYHRRPHPSYHHQAPVHHAPPTLDEVLVPLPTAVVDGRAYGADLVGNFEHHTGSFGPDGFYANYYDEK